MFATKLLLAYTTQMEVSNKNLVSNISEQLGTGSINIFGLPFSGKDTHGKELATLFSGALISGGDILRSNVGPQHIKDLIAQGYMAPTDEYIQIITPYFKQEKLKYVPLILSSVGRWSGEEKSIVDAAKVSGHEIKAVVYLKVSEQEVHRRWQLAERGRHDDNELQILHKRFIEFKEKTLPVIEFYRQQGLLIEIDAMPVKKQVTGDILHRLDVHLTK